jgi:uncharacterized membrane protein
MSGDRDLSTFKKKLLLFPSLLIAAVSLPMALGLVPPNRLYGFRTPASLASAEAWRNSNFWAGTAGVVLGVAGALLSYRMLKNRPVDPLTAAAAAGLALLAGFGSMAAGMLTS